MENQAIKIVCDNNLASQPAGRTDIRGDKVECLAFDLSGFACDLNPCRVDMNVARRAHAGSATFTDDARDAAPDRRLHPAFTGVCVHGLTISVGFDEDDAGHL
jgi:hypothetical protein